MEIQIEQIQNIIYVIRGQKVMLDSDLAMLYEVETKYFNKQVKRNINRFPEDFMFQLSKEEFANLRFHFGTSSLDYGGRRYQPFVFTESGVAMLSSVLKSDRAVQVNISIMRIFIKLRSYLLMEKGLVERMDKMEQDTDKVFKIVFERLDELETGLPALSPQRRKIRLKE